MEKFNQVVFTGSIQDLSYRGFIQNTHLTSALSYWTLHGVIVWVPDMIVTSPHIHSLNTFIQMHQHTLGAIPLETVQVLKELIHSNLIIIA